MSMSAQEIVKRQDEVLQHISRIRFMRRGSISRQTYADRTQRNEGKGAVGPYYLWQGTVAGKRFGKRLSAQQAQAVEAEIALRHEFEALCEEYVELSCQLAALKSEDTASQEAVKKGLKSRSSKAKK